MLASRESATERASAAKIGRKEEGDAANAAMQFLAVGKPSEAAGEAERPFGSALFGALRLLLAGHLSTSGGKIFLGVSPRSLAHMRRHLANTNEAKAGPTKKHE
jgi:hypothetical protein